jgi:hypothetical protein
MHNGIETSAFPFCESPHDQLLFMGRIGEQKGADLAVRAALVHGPAENHFTKDQTRRAAADRNRTACRR